MAYSMLECPKLHNAKSLKLYPEEYDHHVPFRHKNLPPDFELTIANPKNKNPSLQAQNSNQKCPIYIHPINEKQHGDFVSKKRIKKQKKKAVMEKLEESYWANWKPERNGSTKTPVIPPPEIEIIKSATPLLKKKIQVYPSEEIPKIQQISSRSQEIQTDESLLVPKEEKSAQIEPICEEDNKFLKHTDSFILNVKKQQEEKERFEQPKCIRLYRKSAKSASKNYIKGGSYPLKSCLKKESSTFSKTSKLGRPGSPLIVSSHYKNKNKVRH